MEQMNSYPMEFAWLNHCTEESKMTCCEDVLYSLYWGQFSSWASSALKTIIPREWCDWEIPVNVYCVAEKRLFISEKSIRFNLMWPTRVHFRTDHAGTCLQMSDFTEGWLSVSQNTFKRYGKRPHLYWRWFSSFSGCFQLFLDLIQLFL